MEDNTRNFTLTVTPTYTEIIWTDKKGYGSFHAHGLSLSDILDSVAFQIIEAFKDSKEFKEANPGWEEYFNWIESED